MSHSPVELTRAIRNDYTTRDKIVASIIAPVEDNFTAKMPHNIGKRFILGSTIYETLIPIDIGDTIVPGINVRVSDDIFTLIDASKEISGGYVNWNDYGRLDVKNIIPTFNDNNTYYPGASVSNDYASLYVNVDGSIRGLVPIENPTLLSYTLISYDDDIKLAPGDYILSGGIDTICYLYLNFENSSSDFIPIQVGSEEVRFTVTEDISSRKMFLSVNIASTSSEYDVQFKPMIRLASISNSDFVRPCQTVRQLNERLPRITKHILSAGQSSITISVPSVVDSLIEFYTSTGINYTNIYTDTYNNTVTLTFSPQSQDVIIYCKSEGI